MSQISTCVEICYIKIYFNLGTGSKNKNARCECSDKSNESLDRQEMSI